MARWLGFSAVMHMIAAIFSTGYFDSDEHFQILEWLNSRLGRSVPADLAWEHGLNMRSWVQPMIYEVPTRLLMALGIQDPFHWATSARLLTAFIGWLSLVGLAFCCPIWFEERRWREWAVRLTCLFWFAPYLHARTSSESMSGSLFLLAVTLYTLHPTLKWRPWPSLAACGALLAMTCFCRFQMGFAVIPFGIWLIWIDRVRDRRLLPLAASFIGMCILGLTIDAWGYGHWVLAPVSYFNETIIKGASAAIGRSPWNYYFQVIYQQIPPLGAIVLCGTVAGWIARPRHLLSFTSFAFVAVHSYIAHKEWRFVFPIAAQIPVIACFGLAKIGNRPFPKPLRWGVGILLFMNVAVLLVVTLKPATAQMGFYSAVFRHDPPIRELYRGQLNPYAPFSVNLAFYKPQGLIDHELKNWDEARSYMSKDRDLWLFYENFELAGGAESLAPYCKLDYTTYPAILNYLTFLAGPRKYANRWSLYRCRL